VVKRFGREDRYRTLLLNGRLFGTWLLLFEQAKLKKRPYSREICMFARKSVLMRTILKLVFPEIIFGLAWNNPDDSNLTGISLPLQRNG